MKGVEADNAGEQSGEQAARLDRLERGPKGGLTAFLTGRDKPVEEVKVARCFPWSSREQYISICDKEGKEIVLLRDLDGVDPASLELIGGELRDKFFVPKIRRIVECKAEFGVVSICAETDRGQVTFQLRDRDDVRQLSPVRAILRDVDGNIYEVEDFQALDVASQRHLQQYF